MRVKFYGVRGSLPVCDMSFMEFGGNTTCIMIAREDIDRISILDAGTGIYKLGNELVTNGFHQEVLDIGFTHFHWDHIQGFPHFAPFYTKDQQIRVLAMGTKGRPKSLKNIFSIATQNEYFPVPLEKMGARFDFLKLSDKEVFHGALVKAIPQHHKYLGGSYAFRIEAEGKILVICTDIEHCNGIDERIVELAQNADLLIHDGQFTPRELMDHKGWGHSSWEQAIEVAERANVKRLIITHHDPSHNDEFLRQVEKDCKNSFENSCLAREGMEIVV